MMSEKMSAAVEMMSPSMCTFFLLIATRISPAAMTVTGLDERLSVITIS